MTEPFQQSNEAYLSLSPWLTIAPNLVAGISTRNGGVSKIPYDTLNLGLHIPDEPKDVLTNRNILADHVGIPLKRWVVGEQVHGTEAAVVSDKAAGMGTHSHQTALKGIDGLITNERNLLLTAFFADCVPLFFIAPDRGWIGIAHAGWKGTVGNMAAEMVEAFNKQGIHPDELFAAVGPCIGKQAYEVDQNVVGKIDGYLKDQVVTPLNNGKFVLNLRELNRLLLLEAGIRKSALEVTGHCTYQDSNRFYSHRRDQGKTGRMLGFIGWAD
ncbi:peptidoglycan editing factor PgeF [Thalassobacillus pellis]|uniref:peptidoglycan editing factor PgeF n=1 Tax=Thalassobacillus pellis TaxID=748008 RepID=UPI0019614975|nr:peptidoglycan editing factor PgeF [Thalassobacillus pellis]MBM7552839.1 YfiH family protein [Thalassobacillus pellis]